jgi:hypothetical protein
VQRTPARSAVKRSTHRASPEVLARAKLITAKEGLRAAATATGVQYETLWGRANREKWKVAPSPKGKRLDAAPLKPKAKGEKVPMRRCDSCQMTTSRDPCDLCGTKWRANGS